jgi:hypothetical protein
MPTFARRVHSRPFVTCAEQHWCRKLKLERATLRVAPALPPRQSGVLPSSYT